jgi:response regulator NasT
MGRRSNPQPAPDPGAEPLQHPLRVLLVDDGANRIGLIRDELVRQGHQVVGVLDSALLIHDCVLGMQPDVVIVDSESPSRDTLEHLATANERSPRAVVVFTDDDAPEPMRDALAAGVSAYVVAGLQPARLEPVLRVAMARFAQDRALRDQLEAAQAQLSQRKLIERAKGLLMREFGLDEERAHAHLRKLAMDRGERLAAMAERLIDAHALMKPPS